VFPFMQINFHWMNLMPKKIISKFQRLEILNQKAIRKIINFFLPFDLFLMVIRLKIFNSMCMSHVQKIIMQNYIFDCP
jgi:membrane-associated PAP2 superfamily phosphatase